MAARALVWRALQFATGHRYGWARSTSSGPWSRSVAGCRPSCEGSCTVTSSRLSGRRVLIIGPATGTTVSESMREPLRRLLSGRGSGICDAGGQDLASATPGALPQSGTRPDHPLESSVRVASTLIDMWMSSPTKVLPAKGTGNSMPDWLRLSRVVAESPNTCSWVMG